METHWSGCGSVNSWDHYRASVMRERPSRAYRRFVKANATFAILTYCISTFISCPPVYFWNNVNIAFDKASEAQTPELFYLLHKMKTWFAKTYIKSYFLFAFQIISMNDLFLIVIITKKKKQLTSTIKNMIFLENLFLQISSSNMTLTAVKSFWFVQTCSAVFHVLCT